MVQDIAGALEQLRLSGKWQCLERGIMIGRDPPDQLPLVVLPSLLRAVPGEGGGMAGGAVFWDSPLFGQLRMARAHLLTAETLPPFPPLPSLHEGTVHWSSQHPGVDLVSPLRQGPKFLDVVPTERQHDP